MNDLMLPRRSSLALAGVALALLAVPASVAFGLWSVPVVFAATGLGAAACFALAVLGPVRPRGRGWILPVAAGLVASAVAHAFAWFFYAILDYLT